MDDFLDFGQKLIYVIGTYTDKKSIVVTYDIDRNPENIHFPHSQSNIDP